MSRSFDKKKFTSRDVFMRKFLSPVKMFIKITYISVKRLFNFKLKCRPIKNKTL